MVQIKDFNISGLIHAILFSLLFTIGIGSIGWFHIVWVVGLFLFFLIKFGKTSGFRYHNLHFQFNIIDISVLILFAVQLLVCLASTYKPNSIFPLFHLLMFVIVYFYLRWCFSKWDNNINILGVVFSVLFGIMALVAFFQFLLFKFNVQYHGVQDITNFRAIYSPLGMLLNDWISYLILFLPFAIIPVLNKESVLRIISIVSTALICLGLVISFTRGAYISLWVFILVSTVFVIYLYFKTAKKILFLIPAIVIASTVGAGIVYFDDAATTAGMVKTESQTRSVSGRQVLWSSAFDMFKSYPLTGVGQGNFIKENPAFIEKSEGSYFTNRVTNTYLQILSEQGIAGFISWGLIYFTILITLLFCVLRNNQFPGVDLKQEAQHSIKDRLIATLFLSALMAFGIREMVFSSFFYNTGLILIFAIIASWISSKIKPVAILNRKNHSMMLLLFFAFFSGLILWNSSVRLVAASKSTKSLQAYITGDNGKAQSLINSAIKIQPDNALFHSLYANYSDSIDIQNVLGSSDKIVFDETVYNSLKKASSLSPHDALFHHNLGIYYFLNKENEKANEYMLNAISLEPFNELYHLSYGLLALNSENTPEAVEKLINAALLRPDFLDSCFWKDNASTLNLDSILQMRVDSMVENIHQSDIISLARLGRLTMHTGDTITSKSLLKRVTDALPNMNRPWYYLAMISLHEGDSVKFLNYIERSIDLDGFDYLPLSMLGDYYFNENQINNSKFYYMSALRGYSEIYISHSYNIRGKYSSDLIVNLFYPKTLLRYYRPELNLKLISDKMIDLCRRTDDNEAATIFNDFKNRNVSLRELLVQYDLKNN